MSEPGPAWTAAEADAARRSAHVVAERLALPLRQRTFRGPAGNWAGAGRGSSLDFQDQRAYMPGDDPRHVNWIAWARSDVLTMKLYREEVQPTVDLVLDCSGSMLFEPAKRRRTLELLWFCLLSARRGGSRPHVSALTAHGLVGLDPEALERGEAPHTPPQAWHPGQLANLRPRGGSLRVLVSDVLWPEEPGQVLGPLSQANGQALILAPTLAGEREPDWSGNLELVSCEDGGVRRQHVTASLLERYREAHRRHMALWRRSAQRHDALFAAVACEGELQAALSAAALDSGALELA